MKGASPVRRGLLVLIFAIFLVEGSSGTAGVSAPSPTRVPMSGYLVAGIRGHLRIMDTRGHVVKRVPRFAALGAGHGVQALALAPDRRSAYVAVYEGLDHPPRLYKVSLLTGAAVQLAEAISPALSPDRTRLAYVKAKMPVGLPCCDLTGLVVRKLPWGRPRVIPLPAGDTMGTPPGLVINWSPNGRSIALADGNKVRIVNVARARTVESEPAIPGSKGLSPVFLDRRTIVVLANCCVGRQKLVAVDLRSGSRKLFARISSPDENVRRVGRGTLLAVTALHELVRVTQGHVRVISSGILSVSP